MPCVWPGIIIGQLPPWPAWPLCIIGQFIIIPPGELLRRLRRIRGTIDKRIDWYFWVMKKHRCWEGRDLSKGDQERIADDRYVNNARDFTPFLDAWHLIEHKLK